MTPRRVDPSAIPPGTPDRVAALLQEGRAEFVTPDAETISVLWEKALVSARDAAVAGISADTAVDAAYKAVLQATMALLENEGFRIGGGGGGHHRDTFYAAAGLGHTDLSELDVDTEPARTLRARSVYKPVRATRADLTQILRVVARVLPAIRRAILLRRPEFDAVLAESSSPPD